MATAVLVHGCHLLAEGWHDIVWGEPKKDRLGRVPRAVLLAIELRADMIVFSTGASEKDGLKEGEYIYRYTLERLPELAELTGSTETGLRRWLEARRKLELTSQNTRQELLASANMALKEGMNRLFLVSSPTHIIRCYKEAISVLGREPRLRHFLRDLHAVASDTCYAGSTFDDVVVIEPPHRGDIPRWQTHRYARALFQIMGKGPERFAGFLGELGELVQKHGVNVTWRPRE